MVQCITSFINFHIPCIVSAGKFELRMELILLQYLLTNFQISISMSNILWFILFSRETQINPLFFLQINDSYQIYSHAGIFVHGREILISYHKGKQINYLRQHIAAEIKFFVDIFWLTQNVSICKKHNKPSERNTLHSRGDCIFS